MKIKSIHFFRGIAILFIIAGHFIQQITELLNINIYNMSLQDKFIYNFIIGGTGMFVFISGFLFYSVFYKKYEYKKFIENKFKNIYIPYIFLSIIAILIKHKYREYGFQNSDVNILKSIYTGIHLIGYWYITFVMIIFLLSPIFIKFIESKHQKKIIILSFTVSLLIHRPILNLNQLHSVLYFSFFYFLGIWVAINREKVIEKLKNKLSILVILTFVIIFVQTVIIGKIGNYQKEFFLFDGIDLILIQKTLLCLIFFSLLSKLENKRLFLLDKLAEYSFVIYFLHPFFMKIFKCKLVSIIGIRNFYGLFLLEMILTIIICIFIAIILKKILGKYSRYIIGY